jgi:hypothetical protein
MAQYNITITEELLHGLFYQMAEMKHFPNYWKKSSTRYSYPNQQSK